MNKLNLICRNAFETSANNKSISDEDKFTRLGFVNPTNPLEDFKQASPAILALEFMEYFAEKQIMRPILYSV